MEPISMTDPKIIHFFKENDFIDPKKFVEKHILDIVEKTKNGTATTPNDSSSESIDYQKIHKEYSIFTTQQKNIINFLKENTKMVEKLRFDYLDQLVSEKFHIVKESHVCDLCERSFRNLKALATHQRSCIQSEQQKEVEEEEEEE